MASPSSSLYFDAISLHSMGCGYLVPVGHTHRALQCVHHFDPAYWRESPVAPLPWGFYPLRLWLSLSTSFRSVPSMSPSIERNLAIDAMAVITAISTWISDFPLDCKRIATNYRNSHYHVPFERQRAHGNTRLSADTNLLEFYDLRLGLAGLAVRRFSDY